jgi:broad specificity phosphatase PhoE
MHMKALLPHHPTQLYLIRHGEVEERYHKVFGGCRIDMALSPLGHEQGAALARWMRDTKLDAIYASPMLRVQQTIAPLVAASGVQPVLMPDLREVDFGEWTGLKWDGVMEKFQISAFQWLEVLDGPGIPGGESSVALRGRVMPCVQQILHDNPHRSVAIACHGGIIRVILAALLDMRLAHMAHFNIEYGSVTVVELEPEKKHGVEIELLNLCPLRDVLRT